MSIIIGIDHGNGLMKTVSTRFRTGVAEYGDKPPIETGNVVFADGKYYVCDSGTGVVMDDKTKNDVYWHMTLCGIGAELGKRKIRPDLKNGLDVTLAVGLPLTYPEKDRKDFQKYLKRKGIDFKYNNKRYIVNIVNVVVFPQGYSAIIEKIKEFKGEPVVNIVDIGNKTVDILVLNNGKANLGRAKTIEKMGVVRCIGDITEQIQRNKKLTLTPEQIEAVLWGSGDIMLPDNVKKDIKTGAKAYIENVINELHANGYDTRSQPTMFVGGGAKLVKTFYRQGDLFYPLYEVDVRANAKGYEVMTEAALKKRGA